ncbi:hypothetical protein LAZ67_6002921 [Cordylochernes scorpioides]|uniref:Transposase n=1 Tax=Cordylochernes scorpioides TaxID=51811 RepID=A0ABY6KK60_9ARAC|nr:hypothetical protein LAZ67_6002921 [Cordylochernes scorpioides]
MLAVFITARGAVSRVALENHKTVTAKWYTEECLPKVVQVIKRLGPNSRTDTWLFHHDNAPAHRSKVCADYLTRTGLNLLKHPPTAQTLHLATLPSSLTCSAVDQDIA